MRKAIAVSYCKESGNLMRVAKEVPSTAGEVLHPEEFRCPFCYDGNQAYTPTPGTAGERALPMDTAPTDGTMIRLLVDFEDNSLEDTDQPVWTVGACYASDSEGDVWQFAGWNWSHDCFTEGHGKPIGWLPMLAAARTHPQATEPAPSAAWEHHQHLPGIRTDA